MSPVKVYGKVVFCANCGKEFPQEMAKKFLTDETIGLTCKECENPIEIEKESIPKGRNIETLLGGWREKEEEIEMES